MLLIPMTEHHPKDAGELRRARHILRQVQGGEQGIGLGEMCGGGFQIPPAPPEGNQIQIRPAEFIACRHGGKGRAGLLKVALGLCKGPATLRKAT